MSVIASTLPGPPSWDLARALICDAKSRLNKAVSESKLLKHAARCALFWPVVWNKTLPQRRQGAGAGPPERTSMNLCEVTCLTL